MTTVLKREGACYAQFYKMVQSAVRIASGLGLILDLDGVIVDSLPVHETAWDDYLKRIGMHAPGLMQRMLGWRNEEIMRELLGSDANHAEIIRHGAEKEKLYRELMRDQLFDRLIPGIREFLESVPGVPLGLASNAEPANIDFVLDRAGIRRYFSVIVDGSQVIHPKPAPEVYQLAARKLGIAPENSIVFEDSVVGIAAARSAGCRIVGILTQKIPLKDVDLEIQDFRGPELEPWLAAQQTR
jgi:HAD superfamily hydrolase (TIGR01509 family)